METGVVIRWVRPGAVRWSEDNQLFVLSPHAVRILTPILEDKGEEEPKITFLKASITSLDEKESTPWTLDRNDRAIRRSVTLKVPEYVAAAWSPTHCSPTKGCILACVDSRGSVTLHIPEGPPADKLWQKYLSLDEHVAKLWGALGKDIKPSEADKVETVSVAWSPRTNAPGFGTSLLTLGNQAGYVTLWDISDAPNTRHVKTLQVAGEGIWITQLSWSPWFIQNGKHMSYLACGLSNGRIAMFKAFLDSTDVATMLQNISFSEDIFKEHRFDLSLCTGFTWSFQDSQTASSSSRLCIAKGSRIVIWNPEANVMFSWKGRSVSPITHIQWTDASTKIIVMFYDSKSYVLNVKEDALTESPPDSVDSTFLTQNVIGRCHQQVTGSKDEEDDKGGKDGDPGEDGDEDESDTSGSTQLRILSGDSSPDGYCTAFVYFFQGVAQVREKQNATLVLTASRADSPSSKDATVLDHILSDLKGLLSNPSLALSQNPSRYLWNTLFYIANLGSDQFEDIHVADRLLGVFNGSSQMGEDSTQSQTDLVFHVGTSIEDKLLVAMYCNAAITSERAVFYLWTRLKSLSLPTSFKERLKERAEKSIQRIRAHVTGLILEQFSQQVSDVYRVQDTPESDQTMLLLLCDSVVRMVLSNSQAVQNLTELAQHAAKVYRLLKDTFPRYDDLDKSLKVLDDFAHGHTPTGTLESKRETCPACDAPVPFDDETVAMCEYGHTFGRCSLTLQITSWSLFACNGCGLKVSAPSSNHSENWSWMDTVLRASPLCVFCLELRQSIMI